MPKSRGVNEKKAAGMERKAANKAAKNAAGAKEKEKAEAEEWKKGSNARGAGRTASAAQKADEAAKKRQEKAALQAMEEAEMDNAGKPKKSVARTTSKSKKKNKNNFDLLEEALVGDAEKKAKAAKRKERLKKETEERLRLEREKMKAQETKNLNPLLANTNAMIGSSVDGGSGQLNASLEKGQVDASGIDSALSAMSVGGAKEDEHPERRMKALHLAFEEHMMPEMKEQYPGLKRSQYKEKIFSLWKKSPENPLNWAKNQD
jgi:hypothetical protein